MKFPYSVADTKIELMIQFLYAVLSNLYMHVLVFITYHLLFLQ